MTKHPSYRARDQPQNGSASQHRKDKIMHKFEKRDAKSRTLVILAVVGLAAALTLGIFTAVRMIRKPAASKDAPKTGTTEILRSRSSTPSRYALRTEQRRSKKPRLSFMTSLGSVKPRKISTLSSRTIFWLLLLLLIFTHLSGQPT